LKRVMFSILFSWKIQTNRPCMTVYPLVPIYGGVRATIKWASLSIRAARRLFGKGRKTIAAFASA
jgi:hypothetical protein